MTEKEWSALCNYYSLPFSLYLQHREPSRLQIWEEISALKKWTSEKTRQAQDQFGEDYKSLEGFQILTWYDQLYPERLRRLHVPPSCLYAGGALSHLQHPRPMAVVGSRNPSRIFVDWTHHELAGYLKKTDAQIVSGGAVGIDQLATQMAFRQGRTSVVVIPSGFHKVYPANLKSWLGRPDVLFLSEYLPTQAMYRHHFIKRNRIIAGLCDQLLVIQCAVKSGSMISVNYAIELGISVGTVPDFPGHFESSGNLKLLREGAHYIVDAHDLEVFGSSTSL